MRAIAVLLVLVFHFNLVLVGKSGFIGVDIFFVISGYLITSIIMRQLEANTFCIKTFYLNRIRRLAPALFATLLIVVFFGALWLFPSDFKELLTQVLVSQFYVANFYYWQSVNYFGLASENVLLLHTWSLAVEEQFYLIYPFVLLFVYKYLRRFLVASLILGLVLSFALNVWFVGEKPEAVFYLLPTRAWELLAGALIYFTNVKWAKTKFGAEVIGIVGFGLILAAVYFFDDEVRFPGYFALLPTLGGVCLLVSGACQSTYTNKFLSLSPLVYVGRISYPLYLVHWPINVFSEMLLGDDYSLGWRFTAFFASLGLAALLYHFVESPIRTRRFLATGFPLMKGYVAALGATVLMFVGVHQSGGFPTRFPDHVVRLAEHVNDKPKNLSSCEYHGGSLANPSSFCPIGSPGVSPTWLVYGDSHAWAGHGAFDLWLKKNNQSGLLVYLHSCPPIRGIYIFGEKSGICHSFNEALFAYMKTNKDIDDVFLISTWRQAIESRISNSNDKKLSVEKSISLFDNQFGETVESLSGLNKNIYIWTPVPGARGIVPLSMAKSKLLNRSIGLEYSRKEYLDTYDFFFKAVKRNDRQITHVFDIWKSLCQSGQCAVSFDGVPAYFDNGHITYSTAKHWAKLLEVHKGPAVAK